MPIFNKLTFTHPEAEEAAALATAKAQGEIKWAIKSGRITTTEDASAALAAYTVSGLIWAVNELCPPDQRNEQFNVLMNLLWSHLDEAAEDMSDDHVTCRIDASVDAQMRGKAN